MKIKKITAAPIMRTPSAAPTPTPALAPLLSPPEDDDDDDDDDDGDVFIAEVPEACEMLVVIITVEDVGEGEDDGVDEAGEAVVVAGLVDVEAAEEDAASVTVIGRVFEADAEAVIGMEAPPLA